MNALHVQRRYISSHALDYLPQTTLGIRLPRPPQPHHVKTNCLSLVSPRSQEAESSRLRSLLITPRTEPDQQPPNPTMAMLHSTMAVEAILGLSMNDREILWLALQAAGSGIGGPEGNKKLAMMGDSAMQSVLLEDLVLTENSRGMPAQCIAVCLILWLILRSSYKQENIRYALKRTTGTSLHRHGYKSIYKWKSFSARDSVIQDSS